MKIKAEIIGVESQGDALQIVLQGAPETAPEWFGWKRQSFIVPATVKNKKAFFVGRLCIITLEPQPS
jgi:hypothetical protein